MTTKKNSILLETQFRHIRLLKNDKVNLRLPPTRIIQRKQDKEDNAQSLSLLTSSDKIFYSNRDLPRKALHQFKKGQYNPEDTIDLHGMTIVQAKNALDRFIQDSYEANFFVIAVIHGKGRNKSDMPILKNKVNEWLREYSSVIAFCSAVSQDGGAGKVYIMLQKSR